MIRSTSGYYYINMESFESSPSPKLAIASHNRFMYFLVFIRYAGMDVLHTYMYIGTHIH